MLFGLRHPSVIGGDNQQCEIDRTDARDHVLHEILVSRHINKADVVCDLLPITHTRHLKMRKTQIDRDSARFFFRQAIRISSSERFDKRTFPVIDVTRRRQNEIELHYASASRNTRARSSSCRGKIVRRSILKRSPPMYPTTGIDAVRKRAAKSPNEKFRGKISSVTESITDFGNVPPPTCALPFPTLIFAGNPSSALKIFSARSRN